MIIKRYLYISGENLNTELFQSGPYMFKCAAVNASREDFEELIAARTGEEHKIEWDQPEKNSTDYEESEIYSFHDGDWSWYDGSDESFYGRILEFEVALSSEDILSAYWEQDDRYRKEDAMRHFLEWVGYDADTEDETNKNVEANSKFKEIYGFTISEAIQEKSGHYLIGEIVRVFNRNRDANVDECSQWDQAVETVLERITEKSNY